MKLLRATLLAMTLLAGVQIGGLTGCVGAGYVGTGGGVYYGGGPWFQDDVWIGGGRGWYGGRRDGHDDHHDDHGGDRGGHGDGGYIHPAGDRRRH